MGVDKVIGFIGSGNMATAMIGGLIQSNLFSNEAIIVSNPNKSSLIKLEEQYGVQTVTDSVCLAKQAKIIILAVKPTVYPKVISEIKDYISEETIIISIAAGQSIANIESLFNKKIKLVRTMPNTPAFVLEAMSAIIPNEHVTEEELNEVIQIFNSFGKCEVIQESMIDAFIAVSGSSPAYIYLIIEAMADAAVLQGMPREQAYRLASQAVLGSAKMVLETKKHPGQLKDEVCSPGGTTIEAVASLEESGVRSSIIKAMNACAMKSKTMSKS